MFEAKKGGLSIFVASTKAVGDVACSLCFNLPVNGCALARLGSGGQSCGSQSFPQGSEEAALGYALYLVVNQTLCGDPLAVKKTKVGNVSCGAHGGHFFINWKTKGTVSAARKSIGMALKALHPGKMNAIYSRLVRELGGVPKKETFAYVADAATKAIKSDLVIGVVGNIKADKDKVDAMLSVLVGKHDPSEVKGSKSKPSDHTACDHSGSTEVKTNGWSSAVLTDYLRFKIRGLNPVLCDKYLLLPIKESTWEAASKKIKAGVGDYVKAKFDGVGDDLPEIFGYQTLSSAMLCASDVKTMLNNKLPADSIKSAIMKSL